MIKVLVVDDSAVVRKTLRNELEKFDGIDVVGDAADPYIARDKIFKLKPDVITLDLEMPRMDGLSFLEKLMKHHPIPVVVVSSLTPENSETAIRALSLGAVEVLCKPGSQYSIPEVGKGLVRAIRAAARAQLDKGVKVSTSKAPVKAKPRPSGGMLTTHKIIAIGASTGGTQAIEAVLRGFPVGTPGIVLVQHMPEGFTRAFAERLNGVCSMEVREARDGDHVVPGVALIAPGDRHMCLDKSGARYLVRIKGGPRVHFQRPAVDILFQTVARVAGRNAVGAILTGMGRDGAKGLLEMNKNGARTLAEHEKTCVVYGMPREAIELGAADEIVTLDKMADAILAAVEQSDEARPPGEAEAAGGA